jgi:hypothetical protein
MLAQSHQQINTVDRLGNIQDFLTGPDKTYPVCVITNNGSFTVDNVNKITAFPFRIYFLDLQDISTDARANVQDVWSDMVSVAQDYIAMLLNPIYQYDWTISDTVIGELSDEISEDYTGGVFVDVAVGIDFIADSCQVPQDEITFPNTDIDMNVYDKIYIADGTEGTTLSIPEIVGKKVLFVTREYSPIYRVDATPDTTSYVWDNATIELGLETQPNERFLILYRNY